MGVSPFMSWDHNSSSFGCFGDPRESKGGILPVGYVFNMTGWSGESMDASPFHPVKTYPVDGLNEHDGSI